MSVNFKLDTRLAGIKDPEDAIESFIEDTRLKCRVYLIMDNGGSIAGRVILSWEMIPWTVNHPQGPEVHTAEFMPIRGCMSRASVEINVVDHAPVYAWGEVWCDPKNPGDNALLFALVKAQAAIEAITGMAFPDEDDPYYWDHLRAQWVEYFEDAGYTVIAAL